MSKSLNIVRPVHPTCIFEVIEKSPRNWPGIIVHHTADKAKPGEEQAFKVEEYHRYKRKWSRGMGYHLFVDVNGKVFFGERWRLQTDGAHCPYYNGWLGICIAGNFNKQLPTETQMWAYRELIKQIMNKSELSRPIRVIPHKAKKNTECPGTKIDFAKWFEMFDPV